MSDLTDRPTPTELADLQSEASEAARLLQLLASEQRLVLLCRLIETESSVGDLARHGGMAPSAASQHLAKLRAAGIVTPRRDGQTIYYRLSDPAAVRVIDTLCDIFRRRGS